MPGLVVLVASVLGDGRPVSVVEAAGAIVIWVLPATLGALGGFVIGAGANYIFDRLERRSRGTNSGKSNVRE